MRGRAGLRRCVASCSLHAGRAPFGCASNLSYPWHPLTCSVESQVPHNLSSRRAVLIASGAFGKRHPVSIGLGLGRWQLVCPAQPSGALTSTLFCRSLAHSRACYSSSASCSSRQDHGEASAGNNEAQVQTTRACTQTIPQQVPMPPITKHSILKRFKQNRWTKLVKLELSALVCFTSTGGYILTGGSLFDLPVFSSLVLGTMMSAASAAAFNQVYEHRYDAQMARYY